MKHTILSSASTLAISAILLSATPIIAHAETTVSTATYKMDVTGRITDTAGNYLFTYDAKTGEFFDGPHKVTHVSPNYKSIVAGLKPTPAPLKPENPILRLPPVAENPEKPIGTLPPEGPDAKPPAYTPPVEPGTALSIGKEGDRVPPIAENPEKPIGTLPLPAQRVKPIAKLPPEGPDAKPPAYTPPVEPGTALSIGKAPTAMPPHTLPAPGYVKLSKNRFALDDKGNVLNPRGAVVAKYDTKTGLFTTAAGKPISKNAQKSYLRLFSGAQAAAPVKPLAKLPPFKVDGVDDAFLYDAASNRYVRDDDGEPGALYHAEDGSGKTLRLNSKGELVDVNGKAHGIIASKKPTPAPTKPIVEKPIAQLPPVAEKPVKPIGTLPPIAEKPVKPIGKLPPVAGEPIDPPFGTHPVEPIMPLTIDKDGTISHAPIDKKIVTLPPEKDNGGDVKHAYDPLPPVKKPLPTPIAEKPIVQLPPVTAGKAYISEDGNTFFSATGQVYRIDGDTFYDHDSGKNAYLKLSPDGSLKDASGKIIGTVRDGKFTDIANTQPGKKAPVTAAPTTPTLDSATNVAIHKKCGVPLFTMVGFQMTSTQKACMEKETTLALAKATAPKAQPITLSLPAAGSARTLSNGYTLDSKGTVRDTAGRVIAVLGEDGKFRNDAGKEVTATTATTLTQLISSAPGTAAGDGQKPSSSGTTDPIVAAETTFLSIPSAFGGTARPSGKNALDLFFGEELLTKTTKALGGNGNTAEQLINRWALGYDALNKSKLTTIEEWRFGIEQILNGKAQAPFTVTGDKSFSHNPAPEDWVALLVKEAAGVGTTGGTSGSSTAGSTASNGGAASDLGDLNGTKTSGGQTAPTVSSTFAQKPGTAAPVAAPQPVSEPVNNCGVPLFSIGGGPVNTPEQTACLNKYSAALQAWNAKKSTTPAPTPTPAGTASLTYDEFIAKNHPELVGGAPKDTCDWSWGVTGGGPISDYQQKQLDCMNKFRADNEAWQIKTAPSYEAYKQYLASQPYNGPKFSIGGTAVQ
jgi:hypothetical protein